MTEREDYPIEYRGYKVEMFHDRCPPVISKSGVTMEQEDELLGWFYMHMGESWINLFKPIEEQDRRS